MDLNNLKTLVEGLAVKLDKYETKPTKAESKRIRDDLNELRKLAPIVRSDLVAADKAGY